MVHKNTNGTDDIGVMQINSIWLPALAARAHLPVVRAQEQLLADPCFNIAAAGLILRVYYTQAGNAWLPAVGDYHSHTRPLHDAYLAQAEAEAAILFSRPR